MAAMLPMYPLEKVLSTCLMTTLQRARLLGSRPPGPTFAASSVRRLAIPVVLMSWCAGLFMRVRCLFYAGPFPSASSKVGTLLKILLGTQWSFAWGQATSPVLQSPRVTESAPLVAKLRPVPVLPRSAARLHSRGALRMALPCLIPATCVAFLFPSVLQVLAVGCPLPYPLWEENPMVVLLLFLVAEKRAR